MNRERVNELLYQALETERGGIEIYSTALQCAQEEDLREEWEKYLEQTREHEQRLLEVFEGLGLDPVAETPGRKIVRDLGQSLVQSMEEALAAGDPSMAEIVATECVVLAETKDHQNWEVLRKVGEAMGEEGEAILAACDEVEEEEDEHLYHTQGWSRELWLQCLGLEAMIPPPEEESDVRSMAAAAKVREKATKKRR